MRIFPLHLNIMRRRALWAAAVIAALCGTLFGVSAAFGKRGNVRAARPVHVQRIPRAERVARHRAGAPHRMHYARMRLQPRHVRLNRQFRHARLRRRRAAAQARRRHWMAVRRHAARRHAAQRQAARRRAAQRRAARRVRSASQWRARPAQPRFARALQTHIAIAASADVGSTAAQLPVDQAAAGIATQLPAMIQTSPALDGLAGGRALAASSLAGSGTAPGSNAGRIGALTATESRSSALTRIAPATAQVHVRPVARQRGGHPRGGMASVPPASPLGPPSVIQHFVRFIPGTIWALLFASLGLAAAAAGTAVRASRRARRQAGEFAAVAAVAHTDPLTDVLNRRGFRDAVERELARAGRYDCPFVVAYFDVRGLKRVNDTKGHQAGDRLLREVASLLTDSARGGDVVARIGGDEFALLLTEQSADAAEAVARRIHGQVEDRRAAMDLGVRWDLTIGTAAYPHDGETFDGLLAAADRRLYEERGIELARGEAA